MKEANENNEDETETRKYELGGGRFAKIASARIRQTVPKDSYRMTGMLTITVEVAGDYVKKVEDILEDVRRSTENQDKLVNVPSSKQVQPKQAQSQPQQNPE